jgi:nickel-dependent lactate racemase
MTQLDVDIDNALDSQSFDDFRDARVAVAVPDLTRPIDYRAHVGPLLDRLADCAARVTVVPGLGLHRAMSDDELAPLREIVDRLDIRLVQHDARDDDLRHVADDIAEGRPGWPTLPATFHREVAEADRIVSVGTVEPHQYAGFSGGPKGVAIGCAGAETIGAMHGLEFLREDGTRLGATDENPFHKALWRLVDPLPPLWGLQIVPASDDMEEGYAFGPVDEAFDRASRAARNRFFREVDEPFDWLHLAVPDIKAVNFYQASRAATYVALAARPAIREGGTLIVDAACPEGMGQGDGERACAEALARGREVLVDELRSDAPIETRGGQQRAYVVALTLARCDVALVGAPDIDALEPMGIPQFETVDAAKDALDVDGRGERIGDVFHAVPVLS